MQTVTFREVFDDILNMAGFEPATITNIDQKPYNILASFIEHRTREAIDLTRWREWMVCEQRTADANGLISYAQNGKNRIAWVEGVYANDPTAAQTSAVMPGPKPFIAVDDGVRVYQGESSTFWVLYKRAAPRFTTRYYQEAPNTYQVGDVVYWPNTANTQLAGNCYEARLQANGSDFFWDAQLLLRCWKPWLVNACFSDWLMFNGQRERAIQHRTDMAYPELNRAAAQNSNVQGTPAMARVVVVT